MSVLADIGLGWRRPKALIRAKLGQGVREDRALAVLIGACILLFVAQWPRLSREAFLHPEVPLEALMGATLLSLVFVLPLFMYALAAVSCIFSRTFGLRPSAFGARLALFWALLCLTPLLLLHGLIAGFLGPEVAFGIGLLVLAGFFYLWFGMLWGAGDV